jgi:hypothetical protein
MENTFTPPTQSPNMLLVLNRVARAILDERARAENREILDDEGTVSSFIGLVTEKLGRQIAAMDFGEFPLAERARFDLETLFGSYYPSQITRSELDAVIAMMDAVAESFDEEEQLLRDDLALLDERMGVGNGPWLNCDEGVDDYLNELIPYDIPGWIADNVDWELLYSKVTRHWTRVETGFGEYFLAEF